MAVRVRTGIRPGKPAKPFGLAMSSAIWNRCRWSTAAANFAILPRLSPEKALAEAAQSFLKELDNYTLADLVEENQPLYKLLLVE